MLTSLYTAVSGMNANGTTLSAIGDNIANLNTVGFKGSRVTFGDVLSQTITGIAGTSQVGRGALVNDISPVFTQGSFETTTSALDLAIDGDGFFAVSDGGARYYTRAGQFQMDKQGNIVNPDGMILQGYLADPSGNITGGTGNMQIAVSQSPANSTTSSTISVNLNAFDAVKAAAFTLDGNNDGIDNDPANFNYSSSVTVYDSQGGAHEVSLYFVKTASNAWSAHYVYTDPANPGEFTDAGTQVLTFNSDGGLINDNSNTAISFNFGAAVTSPQSITFNYGTGTAESSTSDGLDGSTQFASNFSVMNLTQNGYSAGSLKNVTIAEDGIVSGVFTNGQTRVIGRIALTRFTAPTGLTKLGRNLYAEAFASGPPIIGMPNSSGMGRVLSNTLELSNVDLAEEFVKMISAQRGFQANSRIITTVDELTQELVNLKR
jgi:flagellar hook protein FlgE